MRPCLLAVCFFILCMSEYPAWAHHPTEGNLSLDALIQEAVSSNSDIKAAEAIAKANSSRQKAAAGSFFPEISVEGGPIQSKFDSENNSGTTLYGKAEWNIYRGGKDSSEKTKREVQAALSQKQLDQAKSKIARDVAKIYYDLAFVLESIDIQEKALEINKEQTKLAVNKKSAGFTSNADVIEFELREATIKSDLKQLNQEKENKSRELSVLLGRSDQSSDLSVKGHLEKPQFFLNKKKVLDALATSNPELLEAQANLSLSKNDKDIAKSSFFPTVNLLAKYGKLTNEEKVFGDSNNYFVGMTLNIPLFSGMSTTNEMRASEYQVAANEARVSKQALSTKAEIENLFSQLNTIVERIDLEEKTLSRSEEYYKITLGEYRRGVKNSPDMVGAAERLLNSKIRNLEYRRDYQITFLKILGTVGSGPNDKSWLN